MKNIRAFLHTALEGATIDQNNNLILPPLEAPPQPDTPSQADKQPQPTTTQEN